MKEHIERCEGLRARLEAEAKDRLQVALRSESYSEDTRALVRTNAARGLEVAESLRVLIESARKQPEESS